MRTSQGALSRRDEAMRGVRRAVDEIPGAERPLLALDEQQALAHEDEEALLGGLGVIEQPRPGPEDAQIDSELGEGASARS